MRGAVLGLALATSGCISAQADPAPSDAAELADALDGRVAGEAKRCVTLSSLDGPRIVGEALLYRDGRRLWLSRAIDGCRSLRGDPIVIVEVNGSQLCENDLFRTVPRGGVAIPGPACRFGPFVPYSKPR